MSQKRNYSKWCVVPKCVNTSTNAPDKLFFTVPRDKELRQKWIKCMKRADPFGDKSVVYCCEDHFDVENDMDNYIKYKLVGGRLKLKKEVVPHKFKCQNQQHDIPERLLDEVLNADNIPALTDSPEEVFVTSDEVENELEDPLRVETDDQG